MIVVDKNRIGLSKKGLVKVMIVVDNKELRMIELL